MSLQATVLLILISTVLATSSAVRVNNGRDDDSALLEVGRAAANISPSKNVPALKIVSYNIRWRSGAQLQEIIQLFKTDTEIGGAAILGLQEVDRNKKRTDNTNTAKLIAEQLGKHYAWAAPPPAKGGEEEETGVAILSSYPLTEVHRIVLPHPGPGGRRRVGLGATVKIGNTPIRVYSLHAETRISVTKRLDQFNSVLQDLATYPANMPAIVLGDFNTWQPGSLDKTSKLFLKQDFATPFPNNKKTFLRRILGIPISLKLDWIWLRGLRATAHGIDEKISVSDHWPLWTTLEMSSEASSQTRLHLVVK